MTIEPYFTTLQAAAAMGFLMLIQLIVADVVGIRRKHVPGTPVPADHADVLFRASRTVANTNESIVIFVLLVLYCVFSQASPTLTATAAWVYVGSRLIYAICYYANAQIFRSIIFGVSLLALAALLFVGLLT